MPKNRPPYDGRAEVCTMLSTFAAARAPQSDSERIKKNTVPSDNDTTEYDWAIACQIMLSDKICSKSRKIPYSKSPKRKENRRERG